MGVLRFGAAMSAICRVATRDWTGAYVRAPCAVCGERIGGRDSLVADGLRYYHERCVRCVRRASGRRGLVSRRRRVRRV